MTLDLESLRLEELAAIVRRADPSALLVPGRLLRRVIRRDRGLLDLWLRVPHEKCYRIETSALLAISTPDELSLTNLTAPGSTILLVAPTKEVLERSGRESVLVEYWRLLFHARIHAALEDRWAKGELTLAGVQERIGRIGRDIEFHEAASVLAGERLLLPPGDLAGRYFEFAAVFLELAHFAATLIPAYFPSIRDPEALARLLGDEIGAAEIFSATRLEGAPDPSPPAESTSEEPIADFSRLIGEADRATAEGAVVRAAILRTRAARIAPAALEGPARDQARSELHGLVGRLAVPLEIPPDRIESWRRAVVGILMKSDQGFWPQEARLLWDLEKAAIDWERPLERVNVLAPLAGRPIRQPRAFPHQRDLRIARALAKAYTRLPAVRLDEDQRSSLRTLLAAARRQVEDRIRASLRPEIEAALAEALAPATDSPLEAEFLAALVDTLLDRTTARSYLTFADVRDSIASWPLKMRDLAGPVQFLRGDALLALDRRLARSLPGAYHPAEAYRRFLQKTGSLLFGTASGRGAFWWLVLPIAGAFGLLVAAGEVLHLALWAAGHGGHAVRLAHPIAAAILAAFLALVVNQDRVRRAVGRAASTVRRLARSVLIDIPVAVSRLPQIRRFLRHEWLVTTVRFLLRPFAVAAAIGFASLQLPSPRMISPAVATTIAFGASLLVLNTRAWRRLEESLEDRTLRGWQYVRKDFLPGLYRLLMGTFRKLSESLEKLVTTVDERLRYRAGEGKTALAAKAVLTPAWAPVSYTLRFGFDALIEPRINPVKYVSVVLIIDKLTIPLTPRLFVYFTGLLGGLGPFLSNAVTWFILYALPAFAGFLVWELKENWRLYRANRPRAIGVQPLGLHGKTLVQLLRGATATTSLPTLFTRLRRAERRAHRTGSWTHSRQCRATLEEIRVLVTRFLERELVRPLARSRAWEKLPLSIEGVTLGLSQIRFEIRRGTAPDDRPIAVALAAESGWMVALVSDTGFLATCDDFARELFAIALAGLYKKVGIEIVREQVLAYLGEFPALSLEFALVPRGIEVWPGPERGALAVYENLDRHGLVRPEPVSGQAPAVALPPLESSRLLFAETDVAWDDFERSWEEDKDGRGPALANRLPDLWRIAP